MSGAQSGTLTSRRASVIAVIDGRARSLAQQYAQEHWDNEDAQGRYAAQPPFRWDRTQKFMKQHRITTPQYLFIRMLRDCWHELQAV